MATVTQEEMKFNPVTIKLLTKNELNHLLEIVEEASESDISDDASNLAHDLFKDLSVLSE